MDSIEILAYLFRNTDCRLTGSHYFGTAWSSSDVDVFLSYNTANQVMLETLGFKSISTYRGEVMDLNCAVVYRFNGSPQIDVQLVFNVDLKEKAQQFFKKNGYNRPTKEMWEIFFKLST